MEDGVLRGAPRGGDPAPAPPVRVVVRRRPDGALEASGRDVTLAVGRRGEGLRSVELLLAALGSCMLGTMLVFADNAGVTLDDVRLELEPVPGERPERVAEIRMTLELAGEVEPRRLASLRRAAEHCKVHHTLEQGPALSLEVVHRRPGD